MSEAVNGCAPVSEPSKFKRETAKNLTSYFVCVCKFGFPMIVIAVVIGFCVPFFSDDLPKKLLIAKLTFVSIGLLFAIFQLFLGVLLVLIGIAVDYDIDASAGPAKLKIISASPGILIIISSNILFGFCLMREFEVSHSIQKQQAIAAENSPDKGKFEVPRIESEKGPE